MYHCTHMNLSSSRGDEEYRPYLLFNLLKSCTRGKLRVVRSMFLFPQAHAGIGEWTRSDI